MAAPADSPELAFRLRRFSGVNTFIDPVFLGPQFLAEAQNWIPNQTYRLSKKPGSRQYDVTGQGVQHITAIGRYYQTGDRYLYWYGQRDTGGDALFRTKDDAAVSTPITTFTETRAVGRQIRYGNYLYVGNGIDDIQQVPIAFVDSTTTPVVTLAPIADAPGGSFTPTAIAATDSTPRLDTGSYQFAWAIYNKTTKLYTARSAAQTLTIEKDECATATAPGTPTAPLVYRLFVAPQGWPIEYATAQGTDFTDTTARTFTSFDVTDDRVPIDNNVHRTGNLFTTFRGRVVFAGSANDPNAFCATGTILPGLEQDVFNQGAFFPAWARIPLPDRCTGLGVSGSTGAQDPRSPLVAFTPTKTFLYMGDPFDPEDESAAQIQLSDRIGCPAHDTIVPTPLGLVFMGMDSVYLLGADGGPPQDVGWPIADQIREIFAGRGECCAIYHKYFYKLAIPLPGGGGNAVQWWLDLRQGIGDTPSWWGPHVGPPVSALATALLDPDEPDKGFAAQWGTDQLFLHHQMNLYYEVGSDPGTTPPYLPYAMHSSLRSGVFDAEQPFQPKVFTRLRAISRAASGSQLRVRLFTDGGQGWDVDPIEVTGPEGAKWYGTLDTANRARWGISHWLHLGPLEVQTITPAERPRGLSCELLLQHDTPVDVQLRDFEILFLPTGRKVRYLGEKVST